MCHGSVNLQARDLHFVCGRVGFLVNYHQTLLVFAKSKKNKAIEDQCLYGPAKCDFITLPGSTYVDLLQ